MIACRTYTAKVYYRTDNTSSAVIHDADDTSSTTVYIVSDGWQEVSSEAFVCNKTKIKESVQGQDEPNTDERSVTWERPHRRLATVTASRDRPRQLESTFG